MEILSFIKNKKKSARKVILVTIQMSIDDKVFDSLNCIKIGRNYIAEKYNYDYVKDNKDKKFEYFISEIINSEKDILIADLCYDLNDLIQVNKLLKKYNLTINAIYIPSKEMRKENLEYGETLYSNFNRWLDFYPGEIEDAYLKQEKVMEEIENYYRNTRTSIIEI